MANYITTDTELTSVANAIRAKGGTNAPLEFPSGFVSAIQGFVDITRTTATATDVVSGKVFFTSAGVQTNGTLVIQHYYTGSTDPASSLGVNGDIYLKA